MNRGTMTESEMEPAIMKTVRLLSGIACVALGLFMVNDVISIPSSCLTVHQAHGFLIAGILFNIGFMTILK